MSTPIKTGAWVYDEQRREYMRCDLYEYMDTVLIARCNPASLTFTPPPDEGLWATMHETENTWQHGDSMRMLVATDYTLHYMMQFNNGRWHNVRLT